MTFEIVIAPKAEVDLTEIYDYIAERSGWERAAAYVSGIEALCFSLANFPERGRSRNDLRPGLRTIVYRRRATIAYLVEERRVVVLRVFNVGREITPERVR